MNQKPTKVLVEYEEKEDKDGNKERRYKADGGTPKEEAKALKKIMKAARKDEEKREKSKHKCTPKP